MTAAERAWDAASQDFFTVRTSFEAHAREAVEVEREACAMAVARSIRAWPVDGTGLVQPPEWTPRQAEKDIRARGNNEKAGDKEDGRA